MMLVRTRVAPSAIEGLGLMAVEPVARGTPIYRLVAGFDRDLAPAEWAHWPEAARAHARHYGWVRRGDQHLVLSGDHACFMNHAADPNTGVPPGAAPEVTVALRDIAAGEELTCDYFAFDLDAERKLGRKGGE
jgi:SET domain-containing protein